MQHHTFLGWENAAHRAYRGTRRIRAVHASHGDRALARLAIVDGDDTAAVESPGDFILILAGGYAGVAIDTTIGVTQKLHSRHLSHPRFSSRDDLTQRSLRLLHPGCRVEPISR